MLLKSVGGTTAVVLEVLCAALGRVLRWCCCSIQVTSTLLHEVCCVAMHLLQFVLPTDSPHLAKSAFAMALSPMLWAQHKPDRFDSWSAGIVLLQVGLSFYW